MRSMILVHRDFDGYMPFAADHLRALWERQGEVEFRRLGVGDSRAAGEAADAPESVSRLVLLGVPFGAACVEKFTQLREMHPGDATSPEALAALRAREVRIIPIDSQSYWAQSVAEFALALTICGLRRIPQLHHEIISSQQPWDYAPQANAAGEPVRGWQFGDDAKFSNGTICRKRIRIVGAGNIASRYAGYCTMLGADVRAYDPFANDPCFHRSGTVRERFLDALMPDAEIFAPMVPLRDGTRGMVTEKHIRALPKGCLVVMVSARKSVICPCCVSGSCRANCPWPQMSSMKSLFRLMTRCWAMPMSYIRRTMQGARSIPTMLMPNCLPSSSCPQPKYLQVDHEN